MLINESGYFQLLDDIKNQIQSARYQAVLGANRELICLYWNIGKVINENKTWGSKFIQNLAHDIKLAFPDAKGYSVRNLNYMAKFQDAYSDIEIVQTVSAQLSWSHNTALLDKVKQPEIRLWYAEKCVENGWSLNVLYHQIELNLYERQVHAPKISNFADKLPSPQNELALHAMKDPYIFDFITADNQKTERQIESELVKNVTKLLLELGTGFAFLGNQYHLEVGGEDFYIDLLFYNLKLRCYVVVELKTGKFKPEYAGQLNFYLSAVDGELKQESDNPTIGLLLCKEKNNVVAEYALKDIAKPMGISQYSLTDALPDNLEHILPSAEDLTNRVFSVTEEHSHNGDDDL